MTALLPCPFCGETEELYQALHGLGGGKPYAIDCLGCGSDFTPREGMDVVAAWNRRSPIGAVCAEPNDLAREDPKKAVRTRRILIGFTFIALCCGAGCGLAVWLVGLV